MRCQLVVTFSLTEDNQLDRQTQGRGDSGIPLPNARSISCRGRAMALSENRLTISLALFQRLGEHDHGLIEMIVQPF